MTDELIITSPSKKFEEIKKIDENGIEYWEARELMGVLGYLKWSNFESVVIEKAKTACNKSGQTIENHFADVGKMVDLGSGSKRQVKDYRLSRYACYLIAQNGDPLKKEVALAQTYFAIQTRRQEVFQEQNEKRIQVSLYLSSRAIPMSIGRAWRSRLRFSIPTGLLLLRDAPSGTSLRQAQDRNDTLCCLTRNSWRAEKNQRSLENILK